jgi:hypothetical protein
VGRRRASEMTWANQQPAENRFGPEGPHQIPYNPIMSQGAAESGQPPLGAPLSGHIPRLPPTVRVGKRHLSAEENGTAVDVFTMSLGEQTIPLLPFRNWGQLDVYKWSVQGKLPGTPAGLEVTIDHVKIAGETVMVGDADGCAKLEKLFSDWLLLEKTNLENIHKKRQAKPISAAADAASVLAPQGMRYGVEMDKRGQVHIKCLRGGETLSAVGLTMQGFNGLFTQGLMREPRKLEIGALHDWVELDGELCSFEHGNNEAAKLEKLLNEKYLPSNRLGHGTDVLIFANAASPTGFDIQFPVTVGGVTENRRRTFNDAVLELLLEPARCGVIQPGLIIKICPPNLIFKRKTADGGEAYLDKGAEDIVTVASDDGKQRIIDLSQPVNYARLGVIELTAIFNHPAVNRHSKPGMEPAPPTLPLIQPAVPQIPAREPVLKANPASATVPVPPPAPLVAKPPAFLETALASPSIAPKPQAYRLQQTEPPTDTKPIPSPNTWLASILAQPPIRFDWLSSLLYAKTAERFGNSRAGSIGPGSGWAVALGEVSDVADPAFKGIFLTQKGGFGFLGRDAMLRFHRGVVFLGSRASVLEGIDVNLIALGLFEQGDLAFVVSDGFTSKFDVPQQVVGRELPRLSNAGATVLSKREVLVSARALELVWTVPADQPTPLEPEALESIRPAAED